MTEIGSHNLSSNVNMSCRFGSTFRKIMWNDLQNTENRTLLHSDHGFHFLWDDLN